MPIKVFRDDKNDELVVADDQRHLILDRRANGDGPSSFAQHAERGVFDNTRDGPWSRTGSTGRWSSIHELGMTRAGFKRAIEIAPDVPVIGLGNPGRWRLPATT